MEGEFSNFLKASTFAQEGVGSLTVIVIFLVIAYVIYFILVYMTQRIMKQPVYQKAFKFLKNDEEVIENIGLPIKASKVIVGGISRDRLGFNANYLQKISGSKASAILRIEAEKSGQYWAYNQFQITIKSTHQQLDLLERFQKSQ